MSIELLGPAWPTTQRLRERLARAPETGSFRIGGAPKNSIEQLNTFRDAGLRTPDFTESVLEAKSWVVEGHTVFGRKLLHTRGNDIVLPGVKKLSGWRFSRRWETSDWWSKYIPPTEEWRVHVFNNQTIARGRKIHSGPSWRKAPIRNIGNGWTFDFKTDPPKGLRKAAKEACRSVGYSSGAVDILQCGTDGGAEFYILEVNRCPALTCEYTLSAWEGAIRKYVSDQS
jgi:hypothetical protein